MNGRDPDLDADDPASPLDDPGAIPLAPGDADARSPRAGRSGRLVDRLQASRRRTEDAIADAVETDEPEGEIAAVCRRFGLTHLKKMDKSAAERFRVLRHLRPNATFRHLLRGRLAGHELVAFQQVYQVHTGQATIPVQHVFIVADAPAWPSVVVRRRGSFSKLLDRFRRPPGLELDRPAFNRVFRVDTADADFAALLLSPEMQDFLLERPKPVWQVAPGLVAMIHRGPMRFGRLPRSLERMERFWSLVPEELAWW